MHRSSCTRSCCRCKSQTAKSPFGHNQREANGADTAKDQYVFVVRQYRSREGVVLYPCDAGLACFKRTTNPASPSGPSGASGGSQELKAPDAFNNMYIAPDPTLPDCAERRPDEAHGYSQNKLPPPDHNCLDVIRHGVELCNRFVWLLSERAQALKKQTGASSKNAADVARRRETERQPTRGMHRRRSPVCLCAPISTISEEWTSCARSTRACSSASSSSCESARAQRRPGSPGAHTARTKCVCIRASRAASIRKSRRRHVSKRTNTRSHRNNSSGACAGTDSRQRYRSSR